MINKDALYKNIMSELNPLSHELDKIETELQTVCKDVLDLLDSNLLKNSHNPEAIVFFQKMKGDYFRYLGEFMQGEERKNVIDQA